MFLIGVAVGVIAVVAFPFICAGVIAFGIAIGCNP